MAATSPSAALAESHHVVDRDSFLRHVSSLCCCRAIGPSSLPAVPIVGSADEVPAFTAFSEGSSLLSLGTQGVCLGTGTRKPCLRRRAPLRPRVREETECSATASRGPARPNEAGGGGTGATSSLHCAKRKWRLEAAQIEWAVLFSYRLCADAACPPLGLSAKSNCALHRVRSAAKSVSPLKSI